jgi:hypothetical protein
MRRLQWYARHLAAQRRRPHHHPPGRWPRAGEAPSTGGLEPGQDPGAFPSVLQSRGALEDRDAGLDVTAERARAETEASPAVKDNPWGLSDEDDTDSAMKARLLKLMQEGGCERPNQVLEAAQRLLRDGLDSKSRGVNPADVLEIRRCGTTLIEVRRPSIHLWIICFDVSLSDSIILRMIKLCLILLCFPSFVSTLWCDRQDQYVPSRLPFLFQCSF